MSPWKYKDSIITELDQIPTDKKYIGFIYLITQLSTGKRYIGKKLLTKAAIKFNNGKKKKIRKESDWLSYWSSSPKIKTWIKEGGYDDFTREILVFVSSKGMLAYAEELALYSLGVLESDNWLNENIRSKVYKNWCLPEEAKNLREVLSRI